VIGTVRLAVTRMLTLCEVIFDSRSLCSRIRCGRPCSHSPWVCLCNFALKAHPMPSDRVMPECDPCGITMFSAGLVEAF